MELKVIAHARNGHTDKFGIPRQSRDESPIVTRIVFEPEFAIPEAIRGIEGFSHLWIIWGFSETPGYRDNGIPTQDLSWSPTVRPPRLGGNKRVGVFATRSPFRPNPIGLSSVKLIAIENGDLLVSGADVLDGSPIYDIKPYLSFSDSHPEAQNGFAEETKDYTLEVHWEEVLRPRNIGKNHEYCLGLPGNDQVITPFTIRELEYILQQDPRPAYQDDPKREYKMDYDGWRVTFVVNHAIFVKKIEKI